MIIKFLLDSVTTIPQQLYKDQMSRACEEMAAIDQKDTPFLALALHLECPLWSDDTHLKRQTLVPCYTTAEISRLLDKKDC
ncbi:MAG: PIN domain-containing protein [Methanoregula sp.]|nr:PIN domain-containing protein [Methanoregula sp.]